LSFGYGELSVISCLVRFPQVKFLVNPPAKHLWVFRVLIISPNHYGHGLELSGPCQSNKSELHLNQYPESTLLPQFFGQVWNVESHAVTPIAAPDPSWLTEFTNIVDEVNQECPFASASVSAEIPCANEVGTGSTPAAFQTATQPFGSCQSFEVNELANSSIDFEWMALFDCPDGTNSMVAQNHISPVQSDWDSTTSSSAPSSDCDFQLDNSRVSTPPGNETLYLETQEKRKSQIPILHPFQCPHCLKPFSSERRLRSHIQKYHSITCETCQGVFTLRKDLRRHQQTTSCREGSTPTERFACQCGKNYSRKDHLQRHVGSPTGRSEDGKHHAV